jgi:hypothetical protein
MRGSRNSGRPRSRDGLARATKSLRRKGGKKAGGQIGACKEALDALIAAHEVWLRTREVRADAAEAGARARAVRTPAG